MPTDGYMPNPQMRRAAAKFKGDGEKPKGQKPTNAAGMHHAEGGMEHAHKHVVHHPGGHENPSPGKFHSELHHADGNVEHTDHDSYDEAVEHARPHMEAGAMEDGYGHGEGENEGHEALA